jgi:SAM-dependent methyltransferase
VKTVRDALFDLLGGALRLAQDAMSRRRRAAQPVATPSPAPVPRPAPPRREERPSFFEEVDPAFPDLRPLLPAGARILDLGCGRGRNLRAIRGQGFRAMGLDRRKEGLAAVFDVPRLCADLAALPLSDGSVDAVVAWQVLCLFPIPEAKLAFDEIRRILAPGGLFVFSGCEGASAWANTWWQSPGVGACPPSLLQPFTYLRTEAVDATPEWPRPRWVVYAKKPEPC